MNYLYNGIQLPALPKWDTATYPFAYIVRNINATGDGYEYGLVLRKSATNVLPDNHSFFVDILHKCIGNVWMEGIVGTGFNWALQGKVVWSNTDVYDMDGTLYLAASEPIPVGTAPQLDPLSLWLGWKAGNLVARQRGKKVEQPEEEKTPVAYLYNGVRLPDINAVWTDKETYPYAWMSVQNVAEQGMEGNFAILRVDAYQGTIVDGGEKINFPDDNASMLYALVDSQELYDALLEAGMDFCGLNEWKYYADSYGGNYKDPNPTWSSYDILNADGSVYLAASEPVPVYE